MTDGVLRQYGNIIAGNQLRNTVIDFRVNVVRAACKNNTVLTGFLYRRNAEGLHDFMSADVADSLYNSGSGSQKMRI